MSTPTASDGTVAVPRKAALASFVGSMLEYYDFFIYGAAAGLVFPTVFFADSDPATATLLSLATFGVAYVARPIGAVIIGHFGDKVGRKKMLVLTLLLMGASTFLIGLLPSYAAIGVAAPILLVVLRVLQGLSAAGEQSGANSLTMEHAPEGRRGFFTSFTLSGTQAGLILATLVFIPVAALPDEQLFSWGWRVPFFLSLIVVAVGYWVRRTLPETAEFEKVEQTEGVAKLPVAVLFRDHWASVLRVVLCALVSVVSTIVATWSLAWATNDIGLERSTFLWVIVAANVVALAAIPLWARLSDRIGRRPVFALGALGSAVLVFPFLWAVQQGDWPLTSCSQRCSPASSTPRRTVSGRPCTARCSTPACATPAWRSAPRSGSPSAGSRRPSLRPSSARDPTAGCRSRSSLRPPPRWPGSAP